MTMSNVIDLSKHASRKKDLEVVSAFSRQFSLVIRELIALVRDVRAGKRRSLVDG
jgi:hypothetical protein